MMATAFGTLQRGQCVRPPRQVGYMSRDEGLPYEGDEAIMCLPTTRDMRHCMRDCNKEAHLLVGLRTRSTRRRQVTLGSCHHAGQRKQDLQTARDDAPTPEELELDDKNGKEWEGGKHATPAKRLSHARLHQACGLPPAFYAHSGKCIHVFCYTDTMSASCAMWAVLLFRSYPRRSSLLLQRDIFWLAPLPKVEQSAYVRFSFLLQPGWISYVETGLSPILFPRYAHKLIVVPPCIIDVTASVFVDGFMF
ncbi:uncharacterized protein L969DRAFT_69075 [Mixia osmundae IAM 14324]|uniref:Uncharacterized protein n=1 Tax=Mixia osmundae (strain CBS 9802 / IAM 14324 / JCM 22182 / KY 12970) TaxID=764103 RepID=G7E064_MIXOS|nr:uncharacterized protein L969DRAFT_69075 [Mixia osmundae IAM 14324]KEI42214.1 hypothetical protein L969DRAFT_69075 [Mixia osmundae IAM 14324]GAA96224.1 hypothetical protein E5Q_02888 [Mixia osmundae IAM 14324]